MRGLGRVVLLVCGGTAAAAAVWAWRHHKERESAAGPGLPQEQLVAELGERLGQMSARRAAREVSDALGVDFGTVLNEALTLETRLGLTPILEDIPVPAVVAPIVSRGESEGMARYWAELDRRRHDAPDSTARALSEMFGLEYGTVLNDAKNLCAGEEGARDE